MEAASGTSVPEAASVSVDEHCERRMACRYSRHTVRRGSLPARSAWGHIRGLVTAGRLFCRNGAAAPGSGVASVPALEPVAAHRCFRRSFLTLPPTPTSPRICEQLQPRHCRWVRFRATHDDRSPATQVASAVDRVDEGSSGIVHSRGTRPTTSARKPKARQGRGWHPARARRSRRRRSLRCTGNTSHPQNMR